MPPGIGYGTNAQALIAAARSNGDDPTPPDIGQEGVEEAPIADTPEPTPAQTLKEQGWFQPKGDPYLYKVEGDTVRFATPDMSETGEVSKSQIINDNPQWAERNLPGYDHDPRTATNPSGSTRARQSPSQQDLANDLQGALNRQQSPQSQPQGNTSGQGDVNTEAAFGNVMDLIGMVRKMRQGRPSDITIRPPNVFSTPSNAPDSTAQRPPNARTQSAVGSVRDRDDRVRPTRAFRAEQDVFETIQTARGGSPPDTVRQAAQANQGPQGTVEVGQPLPSGSMQAMQRRGPQFPQAVSNPDTIRAAMPQLAEMQAAQPEESTLQELLQMVGMGR